MTKQEALNLLTDNKHPVLANMVYSAHLHNCTRAVLVAVLNCGSENFSFGEYGLISSGFPSNKAKKQRAITGGESVTRSNDSLLPNTRVNPEHTLILMLYVYGGVYV